MRTGSSSCQSVPRRSFYLRPRQFGMLVHGPTCSSAKTHWRMSFLSGLSLVLPGSDALYCRKRRLKATFVDASIRPSVCQSTVLVLLFFQRYNRNRPYMNRLGNLNKFEQIWAIWDVGDVMRVSRGWLSWWKMCRSICCLGHCLALLLLVLAWRTNDLTMLLLETLSKKTSNKKFAFASRFAFLAQNLSSKELSSRVEEGVVSVIEVAVEGGSYDLGMTIIGGVDTPLIYLMIQEIFPTGAVAKDGRLRVNDQVRQSWQTTHLPHNSGDIPQRRICKRWQADGKTMGTYQLFRQFLHNISQ